MQLLLKAPQKLVHPEALLLMLKALTNDDRYIEMLTAYPLAEYTERTRW